MGTAGERGAETTGTIVVPGTRQFRARHLQGSTRVAQFMHADIAEFGALHEPSAGNWLVQSGVISFMKAREPAPAH